MLVAVRDGTAAARPELERRIGVRALALTTFSLTVGSGIFGLPAPVAAILGPQAIAAYLVCAALFALLGLCMAEAGSGVGRAGGPYAYADEAFGPFVGWIAATLLWFANCVLSSAAVANLVADTIATVAPIFGGTAARSALLLALYATLAGVNVRGSRLGVGLSEAAAVTKAIPLVALVIGGAFFATTDHLRWTGMPAPGRVAEASALLFFAFMGMEGALCASGEVRDPQRTVPRAIFVSLAMVSALYIAIQLVAQGLLGAALAKTDVPLVAAATVAFGPYGGSLLVFATLLSAGGYFASDMLASPRTLYALGRDGQLPRGLSRVHPRFGTPANAIVAYATMSAGLALSGTFRQLALVSSAGTLLLYLICCLGVLRLRARRTTPAGSFRAPFGPLVPLLAAAVIVWLLASLRGLELGATIGLVAIAAVTFLVRGRLAARR